MRNSRAPWIHTIAHVGATAVGITGAARTAEAAARAGFVPITVPRCVQATTKRIARTDTVAAGRVVAA